MTSNTYRFFGQRHRYHSWLHLDNVSRSKKGKILGNLLKPADVDTDQNINLEEQYEKSIPLFQMVSAIHRFFLIPFSLKCQKDSDFESFNCRDSNCLGCAACLVRTIQGRIKKEPYKIEQVSRLVCFSPANISPDDE